MPSYEISLQNDKLPSSVLNWIQDGADFTGNYHLKKKKKVHPRYIFRMMSTKRYYIIWRMSERDSRSGRATAFHPRVLAIKFSY